MKNGSIILLFGALLVTPLFSYALTFTHTLSQGMQGDDVKALQQYLKDHGYLIGWQATGLYGQATTDAVAQFQKDNDLESTGSVGPKTLALLNGNAPAASTPPTSASAQGTTATQADLIASLLAQVKVLQARLAELIAAKNGQTAATPSTGSTGSPQASSGQAVLTRVLSKGSSGSDVTALQQFLSTGGYLTVAPSGYFGPATAAAVVAYQKANNLEAVGSVGPKTRALINTALSSAGNGNTGGSAQASPPAPPADTEQHVPVSGVISTPSSGNGGTVNSTPSSGRSSGGGGGGGSGGGGGGAPASTSNPAPADSVDTTPPAVAIIGPVSSLPVGAAKTTLSVTTNENSSCGYSTVTNTAYDSMTAFASTGATSHTTILTELTDGSTYVYYVKCQDPAGNISGNASVSFSVASLSIGAISVGSRVTTSANLNVRASASPSATKLGTKPVGSLGTIIGGPTAASGHTWWQVNYDNGVSGWSIGDYLVPASAASSPAVGMSALSPHASAIRASEASRS